MRAEHEVADTRDLLVSLDRRAELLTVIQKYAFLSRETNPLMQLLASPG